jgi:uncharacterized membrane-anchored protein
MNTRITLALLALVAAAQIAVPAGIAVQQEGALRWGRQIKVAIQPVDPSQPFMGRYVALQFRDLDIVNKSEQFQDGENVYVALEEDANGFAHAKTVLAARPQDQPYLPARIDWRGVWRVAYTFNRFYLPESAAPEVDRQVAVRRRNRDAILPDNERNAYVTVRVWKNTATLEQLYIDNIPVDEYLRGQDAPEAVDTPKP